MGEADGVDVAAWNKRLAAIDWSKGDAIRGKEVFTRASRSGVIWGDAGPGAGPARSAAGRFSRADLVHGHRAAEQGRSPRYRTTMVVTSDARVYQGIIIYEAVDSILLQTGAGE